MPNHAYRRWLQKAVTCFPVRSSVRSRFALVENVQQVTACVYLCAIVAGRGLRELHRLGHSSTQAALFYDDACLLFATSLLTSQPVLSAGAAVLFESTNTPPEVRARHLSHTPVRHWSLASLGDSPPRLTLVVLKGLTIAQP